jgi:transcriptional regulator
MHPNSGFAWTDRSAMLGLARQQGFARIFAQTPDGPRVAHVPIFVQSERTIRFHLANGNALARTIAGATALVLVEGPNAYVSANWYHDVRGAVPTWNYVAAEFEGPVNALDRQALIALLDDLSAHLEPKVGEDWTRAKMEPKRFEAMLNAITAFELDIVEARGTRKLSQNKQQAEAARLIAGMERNRATDMADAMRAVRA